MDADLALRAVCRALVLPPGGPLLLALGGLALGRRSARAGRLLAGAAIAALLALSLPVVADLLSRAVERYPPRDLGQAPPADVIVVLAGGIRRNLAGGEADAPAAVTLERIACAAALARRTGLPLLLSGGIVEPGEPEAAVMERALEADFGLRARWLETRSRTTRENAIETAAVLRAAGLARPLLVTSAVHMPRAVAEFARVGIAVIPAPAGATGRIGIGLRAWLPDARGLVRSHDALYELAGRLVARLRSR